MLLIYIWSVMLKDFRVYVLDLKHQGDDALLFLLGQGIHTGDPGVGLTALRLHSLVG